MVVTTRGNDRANMDAIRASIEVLVTRMNDMEDRLTERMNGMFTQQQVLHEGFQRMGNNANVGKRGTLTNFYKGVPRSIVADPLSELQNLRQTGSVQEYHDEFESLLTKLDVSEKRAINLFVSGLQKEIGVSVKMFSPKTLRDSICLAKLQEDMLEASKKKSPALLPIPKSTSLSSTSRIEATRNKYVPPRVTQLWTLPSTISGTNQVNDGADDLPPCQKDEIEGMVTELLKTDVMVLEPKGVEEHKNNSETESVLVPCEDTKLKLGVFSLFTQPRAQMVVNQELNTSDEIKLGHIGVGGNTIETMPTKLKADEMGWNTDFAGEPGLDSLFDVPGSTIHDNLVVIGDVEMIELLGGDENDNNIRLFANTFEIMQPRLTVAEMGWVEDFEWNPG